MATFRKAGYPTARIAILDEWLMARTLSEVSVNSVQLDPRRQTPNTATRRLLTQDIATNSDGLDHGGETAEHTDAPRVLGHKT
jgi:hypothetical protein